jgi:hypothetical protein
MTTPRRVLALTSWFKIPEQGMKRFEVLSQASAVSIAMKPGTSPMFLTTSHSTSPWDWTVYYPQEWLTFVKPEHAK